MVNSNTIQKIVILEEAKFDYEFLLNKAMPISIIKTEMNEYLNFISAKIGVSYYFRATYFDEDKQRMLMFYIYRDRKFGNMQLWKLAGISFKEDWIEELEDDGQIRAWLKTKIVDLPSEVDWVVRYYLWKEEQEKLQKEWE